MFFFCIIFACSPKNKPPKTGVLEEVSLDGEMVGSAPGYQFGYSMALNNEKRADHSYLAVGAPRSSSSSADGNRKSYQ